MSGFYAELVGFVLFVAIIARYIWPLVKRMLDRRRQAIGAAIDGAEATRKAAEQELARRRALLDEAHEEAAAILAQATTTATQLRADGHERGEQEYERLVQDARVSIDLDRQRARDEVAVEIGAIVMDAAERVVRAELDAARQRALVAEVIAAAEGSRIGA